MSAAIDFAGLSVDAARRKLGAIFSSHGIDSPELDARILIAEVLRLDLTGLMTQAERQMTVHDGLILSSFADRRLSGEPVARILGRKEFWGLPFNLSRATLVPRPDTETVVEAALDILREGKQHETIRIADIGTGSGAILLALLHELPNAHGVGTDLSSEALDTARSNAQKLALNERASFVECDYASGLNGTFDLIVSNPPYIRSADIGQLAIDVRDHDPHLALDGGDDGLDAYRSIAPVAASLLADDGALIFEIGQAQEGAVQSLLRAAGLTTADSPRRDLAGVNRVVIGRKTPVDLRF